MRFLSTSCFNILHLAAKTELFVAELQWLEAISQHVSPPLRVSRARVLKENITHAEPGHPSGVRVKAPKPSD